MHTYIHTYLYTYTDTPKSILNNLSQSTGVTSSSEILKPYLVLHPFSLPI